MTTRGAPALWVDLIQADEGDRQVIIPANQLAGFEFTDNDRRVDVAKLSLRNDDMRWYDESAFRAGQKLQLSWGWEDDMSPPRRMVVKRPTSGSNPVVITLYDEGVLMDLVPKNRHWAGMTDSQIAEAIADENGYSGLLQDVTPTLAVREGVTQVGTDAAFLTSLARRNGFRWWVDGAGLHWGLRPTGASPSDFFIYRNDFGTRVLAQPDIKANLAKDVAKVRVAAIDPLTHQEVTATVGVAAGDDEFGDYTAQIVSLGAEEEIGDPDDPGGARAARVSRTVDVHLGAGTQDDVATEAERVYRETALARYEMQVPVLGKTSLGAKQLHHWTLPSETMSGLWYCDKAVTTIAPGNYTIQLHYFKDALGKLYLDRLHPVSRNKNNNQPALDENGYPVDTTGMTKTATVYEENGQEKPAWHYVDAQGNTVGKANGMTAEEYAGLSATDRQELANASGGSLVLPGQ
jgi:phage protein D